MDEIIGYLPPQNLEAEAAVLGAIILDGESLRCALLQADDFYKESHRRIFRAMQEVASSGDPVDIVTISQQLTKVNELENSGGLNYLSILADGVVTSANIAVHSRLVKENSLKRQLVAACRKTIDAVNSSEFGECLDGLRVLTSGLVTGYGSEIVSMKQVAKEVIDAVERRYNNKASISGITSGITEIDNVTDGWQAGDLIILAARPGQGKSALAMQFAQAAGVPVGFVSLEMGKVQIGIRALANMSGVELYKLRKGFLGRDDWPHLIGAVSEMSTMPIYFSFTAQKISEIERTITEMIEKYGIKLLFVDYLQRASGDIAKKREQEVAEISRYLKGVALTKNLPVMALAQLNRKAEDRAGGKPTLADLRESGQIEADADIVMFITGDYKQGNSAAKLIFSKGRNIGLGEINLKFHGDTMRFEHMRGEDG